MKTKFLLTGATLAVLLGGCVVEPVRPVHVAPPGVVYIEPTYASPGPGYAWAYHGGYGWGWFHPNHGWHRGWR